MKLKLAQPHILGSDLAGDVVEVGSEVSNVKKGDRVVVNPRYTCGQCRFCLAGQDDLCPKWGMLGVNTNGGYAEYVTAQGVNTITLPDSLSYEQAAALPTVYMPTWRLLMRCAAVKPWESVLVVSASSGVGTAAIQIAKKVIGATVIATTSTEDKAQKARELGADHVILYNQEDVSQRVKELTSGRGVDAVIDHVGADAWESAFASLAPGGRYGICGVTSGYKAQLHMGAMFTKQVTVYGVFMSTKEDFRQIVYTAGKGLIRSIIHQTFSLQETHKAHEVMEGLNFFGKLVVVP